jgi:hypothetical protein
MELVLLLVAQTSSGREVQVGSSVHGPVTYFRSTYLARMRRIETKSFIQIRNGRYPAAAALSSTLIRYYYQMIGVRS